MSDVRVAFDLGAESGRALVGRFDGTRLDLAEARRFPNRPVRLPDGLYWDVLGLFGEICSALGELAGGSDRVRSVGIDSWGCDFGLIDRQGALISNPLHHRDGRGAGAMEKAFALFRPRRSTRRPASSSCRSTRCSSCSLSSRAWPCNPRRPSS